MSFYFPQFENYDSLIQLINSLHLQLGEQAELNRENAHFYISEVLIQVIEQMKCKQRKKSEETSACKKCDICNNCDVNFFESKWNEELLNSSADIVALPFLRTLNNLSRDMPVNANVSNFQKVKSESKQELLNEEIETLFYNETFRWSPPRKMMIFLTHPSNMKSISMIEQEYLCAGCSMPGMKQYPEKFRYCEYYGRYFCFRCHNNRKAVIPARIIHEWDFNKYYVSNTAFLLLEKIKHQPLFPTDSIKNVEEIQKAQLIRIKLNVIKDFIKLCSFAGNLREWLDSQSNHSIDANYSLLDLINIKSGQFFKKYHSFIKLAISHTKKCEDCLRFTFICEACRSTSVEHVIFPWDDSRILRCDECGACYHRECLNGQTVVTKCTRCVRFARS